MGKRLTCQPPAVDKGFVPFRGFDVEEVEEHVEYNFLFVRISELKIRQYRNTQHTLVSSEGIRRVLISDLIALISSMQKNINPVKNDIRKGTLNNNKR